MTIHEVVVKTNTGDYDTEYYRPNLWNDLYVVDENLTIKRNRELIKEHNEFEQEKVKKVKEFNLSKAAEFYNDCLHALMDEFGLNLQVATNVYNYVAGEREKGTTGFFNMLWDVGDLMENCMEK